ncbi:MAG: hypothetical protein QF400_01780 [Candidatus Peribacteraceae bacterium]|nr:hypothetical protein [Candidatus Peribacteraceae bacterium]
MNKSLSSLVGLCLGIAILTAIAPITSFANEGDNLMSLFERIGFLQWQPRIGDKMLIDTKGNFGYLIHSDGKYYRFSLVTGQRKYVSYIGRYYNAATPNWNWRAKSLEIKGDRVTFGPSGRFVRLFKDGNEHTAYGIHEYKYEDRIFQSPGRYGSMGCIVVRKPIMDIIEKTFEVNEGDFEVVSKYGIGPDLFVMR